MSSFHCKSYSKIGRANKYKMHISSIVFCKCCFVFSTVTLSKYSWVGNFFSRTINILVKVFHKYLFCPTGIVIIRHKLYSQFLYFAKNFRSFKCRISIKVFKHTSDSSRTFLDFWLHQIATNAIYTFHIHSIMCSKRTHTHNIYLLCRLHMNVLIIVFKVRVIVDSLEAGLPSVMLGEHSGERCLAAPDISSYCDVHIDCSDCCSVTVAKIQILM